MHSEDLKWICTKHLHNCIVWCINVILCKSQYTKMHIRSMQIFSTGMIQGYVYILVWRVSPSALIGGVVVLHHWGNLHVHSVLSTWQDLQHFHLWISGHFPNNAHTGYSPQTCTSCTSPAVMEYSVLLKFVDDGFCHYFADAMPCLLSGLLLVSWQLLGHFLWVFLQQQHNSVHILLSCIEDITHMAEIGDLQQWMEQCRRSWMVMTGH